jgi:hypothetical protein
MIKTMIEVLQNKIYETEEQNIIAKIKELKEEYEVEKPIVVSFSSTYIRSYEKYHELTVNVLSEQMDEDETHGIKQELTFFIEYKEDEYEKEYHFSLVRSLNNKVITV